MTKPEWNGTTYGSGAMHRWLIRLLRYSDVRIWYAFSAVFVIPFCLIFSGTTRYIRDYFRYRHHYGWLKTWWSTYINFCLFGQVVIDRFALYAGKKFKLHVNDYQLFDSLAHKAEGFVVLSAHVGCYEMAGYELVADTKPFNALVFAGEKASVMTNRARIFKANNLRMIPISGDMSHLFRLNEALDANEIVSIPGDRALGSRRTVSVNLLGAKANLPYGPFSVPAMRGLNVLAINVMKTAARQYTVFVKQLHYDKTATRQQQVQQLADGYAAELSRLLMAFPTQWYNYFDFWRQ